MHKIVVFHGSHAIVFILYISKFLILLTQRVVKKTTRLYSEAFVKTHSAMHFCSQKHMFFKFLYNLSMKEKKPCDLSPSQNWVAHLTRWIFMNFSLSRSLSCTACSENMLTYTSWDSLLNTGNLIKDILSAIKNKT